MLANINVHYLRSGGYTYVEAIRSAGVGHGCMHGFKAYTLRVSFGQSRVNVRGKGKAVKTSESTNTSCRERNSEQPYSLKVAREGGKIKWNQRGFIMHKSSNDDTHSVLSATVWTGGAHVCTAQCAPVKIFVSCWTTIIVYVLAIIIINMLICRYYRIVLHI